MLAPQYDKPTSVYECDQKDLKIKGVGKLSLNLGCGPMIWDGWQNVDAFHNDHRVVKASMVDLEIYKKNSVDIIYSSHSLEHVPIHVGLKALHNWCGTLKPGGELHLAVPDLENICKILLSNDVSEDMKWNWYIYTLFGYQVNSSIPVSERNLNLPVDPGQIHYTCFTKKRLESLCKSHGMKVNKLYSYDGYGTPSLYLVATKSQ